ncbi:unnamed protein product [Trichogramma brassicae]|uniref:RNA-directed DNA polymerase n=1 Tax=Trichogramma brassicae TaxID=86971 RepID=A0A6H5J145_9HYME|nr:unnamed protein product [Trichogramma brassicae]
MVTPPRDSVAEARSGPIALSKSIENLPDQQCDRGKRGDAPVERSDPDEITLVSSEYVAAPYCSTRDRTYKEESEPQEVHEIVTRAEIHETNQAEDGRQIYIDIAAMSQENRFFVNVQIGKFTYRALMDSGAQCCLAGPKMMQDLADRIRPSPTVIGFANSQDESSSGCLPVMLQVDREAGRVVLECVKILPVEMVLGADFGRCWKVDIGMGRDQWRSNDGPWHDFAKPGDTKMRNYAITAECAGITVKPKRESSWYSKAFTQRRGLCVGPRAGESFRCVEALLVGSSGAGETGLLEGVSIQTDASDYVVGAVLTQEYEDGEHPVYYVSRVLSRAEQRYTTTEKECLAVIWAIEKFRPYVEGSRFKVVTDHRALTWLRNFKDPQGRVARWAFKLMEYDFEIVYRKGSVHYVPDALSRAFDKEVCAFEKIEDEWYLKKRLDVQRERSKFKDWTIEDDMLYKRGRSALLDPVTNAENGWRLVVPAERRQRVLFDAHSLTSSGHLGAKKTYDDRAACEYWWPDGRQQRQQQRRAEAVVCSSGRWWWRREDPIGVLDGEWWERGGAELCTSLRQRGGKGQPRCGGRAGELSLQGRAWRLSVVTTRAGGDAGGGGLRRVASNLSGCPSGGGGDLGGLGGERRPRGFPLPPTGVAANRRLVEARSQAMATSQRAGLAPAHAVTRRGTSSEPRQQHRHGGGAV